jgi:hypothetical protein
MFETILTFNYFLVAIRLWNQDTDRHRTVSLIVQVNDTIQSISMLYHSYSTRYDRTWNKKTFVMWYKWILMVGSWFIQRCFVNCIWYAELSHVTVDPVEMLLLIGPEIKEIMKFLEILRDLTGQFDPNPSLPCAIFSRLSLLCAAVVNVLICLI